MRDVGDPIAARASDLPGAELRRHPMLGLLGRVWELRENLSAYDASYVALAESLGCRLVTADRRLARSTGARCEIDVLPD